MIRAVTEKIQDSMRLKFVLALTSALFVVMMAGALLMAHLVRESQYRTLESRGRELGQFLGRAGTDALLLKDIIKLDGLVEEAVKSQDMIYAYITDDKDQPVTALQSGLNVADPAVKALLAIEKTDSISAFLEKLKKRADLLEVTTDVTLQGSRIGTVVTGLTKAGAKKDALAIIGILFLTAVLIVAVISVLVWVMVQRMIVTPTAEAMAVAANTASGDLTQSVQVRSADELGMVGRSLNRMITSLKAMIASVQGAARGVETGSVQVKDIAAKMAEGSRVQTEAVEEAASSTNEMHFSLKEIAENVDDLSKTSEHTSSAVLEMAASVDEVARTMTDLSASIEDTTTAITQMSAAIRQIAENVDALTAAAEQTAASANQINAAVREVETNAQESASLADAVAGDAEQLGMRAIEQTIESMGRIEEAGRMSGAVIGRLQERSQSIGSILTVIEDITDQTALLALNASILAAQAGEHGKGFGVVATEIRELAHRTGTSTQEIAKLIAAVQEEVKEAGDAMSQSSGLVDEGVRRSRDAGQALRTILDRALTSRDMSRSISKAAQEQARGVKQVSDAVERINSMTHQIARATSEQKSGSEQIIRASEKMREITRFVKAATTEQAKGGKDITTAVEQMNTKISMVHRAAEEVRSGSDLIVKAIDRIKTIARESADLAEGLNKAVTVMSAQGESLKKETEKFRTGGA